MSLVVYPLSDIQLPIYLNWLTCSTCWSSINGRTFTLTCQRCTHDLCFLHIKFRTIFISEHLAY